MVSPSTRLNYTCRVNIVGTSTRRVECLARHCLSPYLGAEAVEAEALRSRLMERLPEYVVPAAYVRLDALALTLNGKVDGAALPAPEGGVS